MQERAQCKPPKPKTRTPIRDSWPWGHVWDWAVRDQRVLVCYVRCSSSDCSRSVRTGYLTRGLQFMHGRSRQFTDEQLPCPSHDTPGFPLFLVGLVWEPFGRLPTYNQVKDRFDCGYKIPSITSDVRGDCPSIATPRALYASDCITRPSANFRFLGAAC